MKKLCLFFAFLGIYNFVSAQWWDQSDWSKTSLNDFGFYNQYINKYKLNTNHSWDDNKYPWNRPDKSWTNILLPWGNVGIGTLTPEEKLHVVGNVKIEGILFTSNIQVDTMTIANLIVTRDILARSNILVNGSIGIGVAIPSQKLDIAGNLKVSNSIYTDSIIANGFRTGSGLFSNLSINGNLLVSGNTGFGVAVPTEKLDIAGNLKVSHSIFSDSIITNGFRTGSGIFGHLSINNDFFVSGKTGLGIATPAEKLEVAGNIKATQNLLASGIIADSASFSKDIHVRGNLISGGTISSDAIYTNTLKLNNGQNINIENNVLFGGNAVMNQTLAIGTITVPSGYLVAVKGKIIAEEIKVRKFNTWPDYVFDKNYKLPSLTELEQYIQANQHLPGIPSVKQVETEGVSVGEMQSKLLEKVEELTLYLVELKKQNEALTQRVEMLEKQGK